MISIPFSGSKRYSYKRVKEIAEQGGYDTVLEPFGGSCVLSVNLYNDKIVRRAVVNDYDRFFDLYPEYLNLKDKVVEECYKRGFKRTGSDSKRGTYYFNDDGSVTPIKTSILCAEQKKILQTLINKYVPKEYWKYFALGGNFTHSAVSSHQEVKLADFSTFSHYLKTDKQRKYLEVLKKLEVEHLDHKDFLKKYETTIKEGKSLLILDPPYIGTAQNQYNGQFSIENTKALIKNIKQLNCDFIFFNHNIELIQEWLKGLQYSLEFTGNGASTANHKRKDVMAYVQVNSAS